MDEIRRHIKRSRILSGAARRAVRRRAWPRPPVSRRSSSASCVSSTTRSMRCRSAHTAARMRSRASLAPSMCSSMQAGTGSRTSAVAACSGSGSSRRSSACRSTRKKGGPLTGLDADYARAFAKSLGVKCEFVEHAVECAHRTTLHGADRGRAAASISSGVRCRPMASYHKVAYSETYTWLPFVLCRRSGDQRITSVHALKDKTVGIINDPGAFAVLEQAGLRWADNAQKPVAPCGSRGSSRSTIKRAFTMRWPKGWWMRSWSTVRFFIGRPFRRKAAGSARSKCCRVTSTRGLTTTRSRWPRSRPRSTCSGPSIASSRSLSGRPSGHRSRSCGREKPCAAPSATATRTRGLMGEAELAAACAQTAMVSAA